MWTTMRRLRSVGQIFRSEHVERTLPCGLTTARHDAKFFDLASIGSPQRQANAENGGCSDGFFRRDGRYAIAYNGAGVAIARGPAAYLPWYPPKCSRGG